MSIHALVAKIEHSKFLRLCADGEFLAIFCVLYFQRAGGHTMCASMADIPSVTAKIRRGKKKLECGPMLNVMAALPNIGGALC